MKLIANQILILLLLCGISIANAKSEEFPNIVLLMGDDHGWDEVGYNGHPHLKTPVLDEMATVGLRFDRFYAAHPTCSPTRGSVLTGRHPNRYGTFTPNFSFRPEEITIAQLLKTKGYTCGHFGKWHVGPVKSDSPTNPGKMGFDEWLSHDNFFELNPVLSANGAPPKKIEGESSEILVAAASEFIAKAQRNKKPFFVVIWYGSPHEPYSGLPKDLALYDELPERYNEKTFRLTSNETGRPTTRPLGDILRERYAEITAMDRSIGQLREFLDTKQLRDDTLLWYCGDNGTPGDGIVTSPLRGRKSQMYDGGIRVPGVIEWPARIKTPLVSQLNSVTSDILPTLCELVGIDLPSRELDGISLMRTFDGALEQRSVPIFFWQYNVAADKQREPWISGPLQIGTTPLVKMMGNVYTRTFKNFKHPEIVASDFGGSRVVLADDYKLVVAGNAGMIKAQLFKVPQDVAEKNDIAAGNPEVVQSMLEQLRKWQTSVLTSLTGAEYKP
ncbi:MAG: sulfatase-like hydrolase/transferase [Planctomycetaceae bacterium]|jgi:arylsulfatase A-like enzyme|nr:sulfatase-like hydrolase/transferase [Planctomycetaceae bacterium]MBT5598347.1 sulfatase-like hydrolase/transferase [Planctomycetaceae bacterium]